MKAKSPAAATIGLLPSQDAKAVFTDRITFTPGEVSAYFRARSPRLLQRGRQWRGVCPLHAGKRFSFSVNSETGRWFCFSDCGRGGDILDFEIALTGSDFKSALVAVYASLGRAMPARARVTFQEWRTAQEVSRRAEQERTDADYFACAATLILEGELAAIPADSPDRLTWTRILGTLRVDPLAIYRTCRERDNRFAAAWVHAVREHDRRAQMLLAEIIMQFAVRGAIYAA